MKKIEKHVADAYFRAKTRNIVICLLIWAAVSYGVVAFAEYLTFFKVNGMPFHYFM